MIEVNALSFDHVSFIRSCVAAPTSVIPSGNPLPEAQYITGMIILIRISQQSTDLMFAECLIKRQQIFNSGNYSFDNDIRSCWTLHYYANRNHRYFHKMYSVQRRDQELHSAGI